MTHTSERLKQEFDLQQAYISVRNVYGNGTTSFDVVVNDLIF